MDLIQTTGTYTLADGTTPARGTLTFQLTSPILDASGNQIATTKEIVATLINGAFSQTLVATNTPGNQPAGVTYSVAIRLAPNYSQQFSIVIPYDAPGGTIDMSDITPVEDSTITYGVTSAEFAAFTARTTDVHGIADTAQLPAKNTPQAITGAWDFTGGITQNGQPVGGNWGEITGTLSSQPDLQTALDDKATTTELTEQLDLPRTTMTATMAVTTINGTKIPLGKSTVKTYVVPSCEYAILRLLCLHVDYITSGGFLKSWTTIQAGPEDPYIVQYFEGNVDHEVNDTMTPGLVLHTGDIIATYADTSYDNAKVIDATYILDLYS